MLCLILRFFSLLVVSSVVPESASTIPSAYVDHENIQISFLKTCLWLSTAGDVE